MRARDPREDTKNLSLISVSGVIAVIVTGALLWANATMDEPPIPIPMPVLEYTALTDMGPVSGSPRIYGTLVTRRGDAVTGFIRWDRNEGSWSDLLDANKLQRGRSATQAGIRFGHVHRIERTGSNEAAFILKSGHKVRMEGRATDLGDGLRALLVDTPGQGVQEFDWSDMAFVEFEAAPESLSAQEARIHGTLTTRSGLEFTGYIAWDIDEIYTTDILDGEEGGVDRKIPFGAIASIERDGSSGARVTLLDGTSMVLRGTNDVNSSIGAISVSDATLGEVKMGWDEFGSVRFHEANAEPGWGFFDGGHPLEGTVVTESGQEYSGVIAWDNDESVSWEMLNGELDGVEFQVEFGHIARIQKTRRGALVELKDGRVFELDGSNDVNDDNRGITVRTNDGSHEIEWEEFSEARLSEG